VSALSTPAMPILSGVLRGVTERLQRASGAAIVTLYLFDADSRTFHSPVALGIPEEDLLQSIPDMQDQLAHYLADEAQGKVPATLQVKHYGPNVWLAVTRQMFVARDAQAEIDSSFIRRHAITSVVGLPLLSDDVLVGLLYLDFRASARQRRTSGESLSAQRLAAVEHEAREAAHEIRRAQDADGRTALAAATRLAVQLSTTEPGDGAQEAAFRDRLTCVLADLLAVTGLDAAFVYRPDQQPGRLHLVTECGIPEAPAVVETPHATDVLGRNDVGSNDVVQRVLAATGRHLVGTYPLRLAGQPLGYLLVASHDRLAPLRRTPAAGRLLSTAADLIAGALAGQQSIAGLEDANRVLTALSRLSGAVLQPGASRQFVLDALVEHLTSARTPEFDFQLASAFLLDEADGPSGSGDLVVRLAAGTAITDSIDAMPSAGEAAQQRAARVPRWVLPPNRALAPDDVLVFTARHWQTVVVGATTTSDEHAGSDFIVGYPAERLDRRDIPAMRSDGSRSATAPAVLIADGRATHRAAEALPDPPFTLDGDIFEQSAHGDLVRVFVPFGLDTRVRASGVLEAGYHRSHKRQLERSKIEALRACAAQIAVAIETARLYEDAKRHLEQSEITTNVSQAIAATRDLDQTLRVVAKGMAQLVDASLCQIALFEEDGSAWHGIAATESEDLWRRQRGERPEPSLLLSMLDRGQPLVIDDAQNSELVSPHYARLFGIRSLLAIPLLAGDQIVGAAILAQQERPRRFAADEVQCVEAIAWQAANAIRHARAQALVEEEHHIQKDIVLVGLGTWGQKAYRHLLTLKQFFNFKTHVVHPERQGRREQLAGTIAEIQANGDMFYWDSPTSPAIEQLRRSLDSSCHVITYIATPAATHLPMLAEYYALSDVIVIEKPLGASPEAYREFLDSVDGGVEIVAADHYFFKLEVRLLQLLLTEERTLRSFIDSVELIELDLIEEQPLTGAAADIGIIADMLPHAFAIVSLFTPIDRIQLDAEPVPLLIGRQEPLQGQKETYARLSCTFPRQGRTVRLVIDMGKGVETSKWIKLSGEKRAGGRRGFYKFDFVKGEAIDGTQANLRAAIRPIREPGVPDTAHLTMLKHVIEKRHPAIGILAVREAIRSNERIQKVEALAAELLARGEWTAYQQGQRPVLSEPEPLRRAGGGARRASMVPGSS
jgi:GAF domain-containing protein